jgi:TatA/E family protein of Tat protein translocase
MQLGFPEMIFLFVLALIIFGPKKMPEIGRQIGRALSEFRRASNEFKSQIESEISQLDAESNVQNTYNPPPASPENTIAAGGDASAPFPEVIPPAKGSNA